MFEDSWETTRGTFSRKLFRRASVHQVVKHRNPWILPRSILVLANTRIHIYSDLEEVVHRCGVILLYLPPYCPQLYPVEVVFGHLKQWLVFHANLVFPSVPSNICICNLSS